MARDVTTLEAPTRREYVKYGGAVVTGGLLAGCAGSNSEPAPAGTAPETTPTTVQPTEADESYTVSIEPMGEVAFEQVPERWMAYKSGYGGMGIDLGMGDGLVGIDRPDESLRLLIERFYRQLPGFELAIDGVTNIRGGGSVGKEVFYEMDADVHLLDPMVVARNYFQWDHADINEITENVAPFFGSYIRRSREGYVEDNYEFYTLYEAFEKVSKVFERHDRYEAFATLHDEFLADVESKLPPKDERPAIGLLNGGSDPTKGKFYPMDPTAKGYEMKQYRDLGIKNAFAGVDVPGETADYELLTEVDPEIIIFHWGVTYTADQFQEQFATPLKQHPIGRELTAVQKDNIYPGGTAEQGPVINLFQTEMLAQQQYPADFGHYPGLGETPDQPLFDRQRVADIVNGDV